VKRYSSSQRRPLSTAWLQEALVRPGGFWRAVQVVAQTGSTHDDLLAAARDGAAEGTVLVAEAQSAGRGRMGRHWVSPPGAGLTFSVLLRPAAVPAARRGWLPLLTGVAIAAALRAEAGVDACLKWPNDVLVNDAKLVGVLAEQAGDAVVVGAGLNVSTSRDELPAAETTPSGGPATSLVLEGATLTDRGQLLALILAQLEHWYLAWGAASGDAVACGLLPRYQQLCATIGHEVRVQLPGGTALTGSALEVDPAGRLLIQTASGLLPVSAGDMVHLR
jgi:BirA family transcriptional regulator, biotin operon repressor / biotin---[acetyl-CoA-carboxylase] ligase